MPISSVPLHSFVSRILPVVEKKLLLSHPAYRFQGAHFSRAQHVANLYSSPYKTGQFFAKLIKAKLQPASHSSLSTERLWQLILAGANRPAPALPVKTQLTEINRPTRSSPQRSILKKSFHTPIVQSIPSLSVSQIFQGIIDLNLLATRDANDDQETHRAKILAMCRALNQEQRDELAQVVNVVEGTRLNTQEQHPFENTARTLERLGLRNENRRRTDEHNQRLPDHTPARFQLNAHVNFFKASHGVGNVLPGTQTLALKLNPNDRYASSVERVVVTNPTGETFVRQRMRTEYQRSDTDELSLKNQLAVHRGFK